MDQIFAFRGESRQKRVGKQVCTADDAVSVADTERIHCPLDGCQTCVAVHVKAEGQLNAVILGGQL